MFPALGNSSIYPVMALKTMFYDLPATSNDHLFLIKEAGRTTALTDSIARKQLKSVANKLQDSPHLTCHMFGKGQGGGGYLGFQHGVLCKVKVGVLRPVQQPGSYWDRSSELPLVGLEPTEVTAYD